MTSKLPPAILYPLVALCSTLWLHAGSPLLPLGALAALAAKDLRRLGRRRFIPIAIGAALGFAGQGLFVGAPSWEPDAVSAGWRLAVQLPTSVAADTRGRLALQTIVRTEALPPEAEGAFTEGQLEPSRASDGALKVGAADWHVSEGDQTYQQRVAHADGSQTVVSGTMGPHFVYSVVRIHPDAARAELAYGWLEAALRVDVEWPIPPDAGSRYIGGAELSFDPAGRQPLGDAVVNLTGTLDPEGRPAALAVLYRRGRVVIHATAARADLDSADAIIARLTPALERVAAAAASDS